MKDPDHRKITLLGLMHKVDLQRVLFPIDCVFARQMEVELQERELPALQSDGTPGVYVDLDGMSVIHDLARRGLPLDFESPSACRDRIRQIDRRLLDPAVTDREGRIQPTPLVRSGVAFVAPVNLAGRCALRALRVHLVLCIPLARCIRPAGVLCASEEDNREYLQE